MQYQIMAATLIDFYLYIQWAFKWYIWVKPNIDLSNPIYQLKCPVKHYCHSDCLGRHHLTLSHDLIIWPQVTLDMSITPEDLCRWQSFTERCNDSVTDKTKQSKWMLWGEDPRAWQLPVVALTSLKCENQIRGPLPSQIPIINYTSVKSQRFKCCCMWCWRVKQMHGEKTGAKVIQKKIYIPGDTEARAPNRQRCLVWCIHRAASCSIVQGYIDRLCWKQTHTWLVLKFTGNTHPDPSLSLLGGWGGGSDSWGSSNNHTYYWLSFLLFHQQCHKLFSTLASFRFSWPQTTNKEIKNNCGNQHVMHSETLGLKLKNLSEKSGSLARVKNDLLIS